MRRKADLYKAETPRPCRLEPNPRTLKGDPMPANVGDVAPDFTLPSTHEDTITLSQFRGQKHVLLSFHVFDFTGG